MKAVLMRYATPFTTGLFLVSTVSGVALFFNWQQGIFHQMHVWLSMVWLLPFIFHMWRNWAAMMAYIRRRVIWIPLLVSLAAAAAFPLSNLHNHNARRGPPRILLRLQQAPLNQIAPLLSLTPDALQAELRGKGYTVASTHDTPEQIGKASDRPVNGVLSDLDGGGSTRGGKAERLEAGAESAHGVARADGAGVR